MAGNRGRAKRASNCRKKNARVVVRGRPESEYGAGVQYSRFSTNICGAWSTTAFCCCCRCRVRCRASTMTPFSYDVDGSDDRPSDSLTHSLSHARTIRFLKQDSFARTHTLLLLPVCTRPTNDDNVTPTTMTKMHARTDTDADDVYRDRSYGRNWRSAGNGARRRRRPRERCVHTTAVAAEKTRKIKKKT